MKIFRSEQRSLFGEILDWMLTPLLLLWPISLALTWLVAQNIANKPFDRDLAEMTRVLSKQVVLRQSPEGARSAAFRWWTTVRFCGEAPVAHTAFSVSRDAASSAPSRSRSTASTAAGSSSIEKSPSTIPAARRSHPARTSWVRPRSSTHAD